MNSPTAANPEGGTLRWYPLRIFHSSVKRQRDLLEELDKEEKVVETYIPLSLIDAETEQYVPALRNYIFVRIALNDLKALKEAPKFNTLRYVMKSARDDKFNKVSEIAHISDREMANFRQVIDSLNEQVVILQNSGFAMRPGQKVRITEGPFKNVEGTLKSIQKHLCVVVTLESFVAVAIKGIHRKHIIPAE